MEWFSTHVAVRDAYIILPNSLLAISFIAFLLTSLLINLFILFIHLLDLGKTCSCLFELISIFYPFISL